MSLKEHIEGLKNGFGRTFKKCLSLILCLCVLTSVVSGIAGCQLIDDLKGLNGTNNYLSETELARLIANAINSEDAVADSYAKIPSNQLDGLSYSVFYEYCSILRKASKVHGTADSFRILDKSESDRYFDMIDHNTDDMFQTIDQYGDMDVVELCYSKDKSMFSPPVRFTIAKNGDTSFVASRYIAESMLAYSYINHYFEMIDDNNVDALEAIIKTSYDQDVYYGSVIYEKANCIVDYYKHKVKTVLNDYELRLFSPTHIQYVIPEVFAEDGDSFITKTVDLRLQNDGTYFLEDDIPVSIDELRIYKTGGGRLRMGSTYTANELYKLLGDPIIVSYDTGVIVLTYDGMTLRLEGDTSGGQWTSGRLSSVVLRKDEQFSLGDDLYIGMNTQELLLIYPMFDECDFTSSFENGDGKFILSFRFDDYGNVTRIRLGEVI